MISSALLSLSLATAPSIAPQDLPFEAAVLLLAGEAPQEPRLATTADVDGNGTRDLIRLYTFSGDTKAIQVLPNLGNGVFGSRIDTELPGVDALNGYDEVSLYARDFDGDGRVDLVAGGRIGSANVVLYLAGNGDGTFASPVDLVPGLALGDALAYAALEFDGDSGSELAIARSGSVFFQLVVEVLDFAGGGPPVVVASATVPGVGLEQLEAVDLHGSGLDSLAVDTTTTQGFHVLSNMGGNALSAPAFVDVDIEVDQSRGRMLAADIDGDLDEDLVCVTVNQTHRDLQVVLNTVGGLVTQPSQPLGDDPLDTSIVDQFVALSAVDWNGDGLVDVVGKLQCRSSFSGSQAIALLESAGDGTFRPARWLPDASDEVPAGAADLDGDGSPDFVGGRAWLRHGTPFVDSERIGNRFGQLDQAADLDLDGDLDGLTNSTELWLESFPPTRATNDATGATQPESFFSASPVEPNSTISSFALNGDLDGDGRPEVLLRLAEPVGPFQIADLGWRLYELAPGGRYELAGSPLPSNPNYLNSPARFVDVNGDGHQDVALAGASSYQPGDGTGALLPVVSLGSAGQILASADVDGDGDVDVLLRNNFALELLRSDGAGGYSNEPLTPNGTAAARFLDVDDDGDLDVVTPQFSGLAILQVVENMGGSFQALPPIDPGVDHPIASFAVGDVDGDGSSDLVAVAVQNPSAGSGNTRLVITVRRTGPGVQYDEPLVQVGWANSTLGDADSDGDLDVFGMSMLAGQVQGPPLTGTLRQYGASFPGTGGLAPILGGTGPLAVGSTTASLRVVGAVGGTLGFIGLGSGEANLPGVPLPGLALYALPLQALIQIPISGVGAAGEGEWSFTFGNLAPLAGTTHFYQVFVLDPGAPGLVSATNGLEVTYGG